MSAVIAAAVENRIVARVVLMAWGGRNGDDAIFVEEKEVDVTDAVLLLEHDLIVKLEDASDQSDELGFTHVDHSGPLEVYVTNSILTFFNVDALEDITVDALGTARERLNLKRPKTVRTIIEVEVITEILPGFDTKTAFDDLSIKVQSNPEKVIFTRVQRMLPAAGRAALLPAVDPSKPRFMQALALANAVRIDNGAILTSWTSSEWVGEATNEVLRFSWTDGEYEFSMIFTEEGIEAAQFDDTGRFFATDHEGTLTEVRFFNLAPICLGTVRGLY